jgi:hypothetical protein
VPTRGGGFEFVPTWHQHAKRDKHAVSQRGVSRFVPTWGGGFEFVPTRCQHTKRDKHANGTSTPNGTNPLSASAGRVDSCQPGVVASSLSRFRIGARRRGRENL